MAAQGRGCAADPEGAQGASSAQEVGLSQYEQAEHAAFLYAEGEMSDFELDPWEPIDIDGNNFSNRDRKSVV